MKKIINGKKYDTQTAKAVGEYSNGYSYSDFNYVRETLYLKKTDEFFLYGEGGAMTRYHERVGNCCTNGEAIIPLTRKKAMMWAEENMTAEEYEEIFGEVNE